MSNIWLPQEVVPQDTHILLEFTTRITRKCRCASCDVPGLTFAGASWSKDIGTGEESFIQKQRGHKYMFFLRNIFMDAAQEEGYQNSEIWSIALKIMETVRFIMLNEDVMLVSWVESKFMEPDN